MRRSFKFKLVDGGLALSEAKDFCREIMKKGRVEATKANRSAEDNGISESDLSPENSSKFG
jgi:hypothetical protein